MSVRVGDVLPFACRQLREGPLNYVGVLPHGQPPSRPGWERRRVGLSCDSLQIGRARANRGRRRQGFSLTPSPVGGMRIAKGLIGR